jgi:hypothetical protein
MTFDIPPDKVQQLIEEQFADLHVQIGVAKSAEEKAHLLSDAKRYVLGLRDFYSCTTPSAMPALARADGQVDDDIVIQTILDTALHTIQQLEEQ